MIFGLTALSTTSATSSALSSLSRVSLFLDQFSQELSSLRRPSLPAPRSLLLSLAWVVKSPSVRILCVMFLLWSLTKASLYSVIKVFVVLSLKTAYVQDKTQCFGLSW